MVVKDESASNLDTLVSQRVGAILVGSNHRVIVKRWLWSAE